MSIGYSVGIARVVLRGTSASGQYQVRVLPFPNISAAAHTQQSQFQSQGRQSQDSPDGSHESFPGKCIEAYIAQDCPPVSCNHLHEFSYACL